ncbi:Ankyrin repeat and SOCS box protein 5 [Acipenser ruthenus]|uniref:Ankyrin repeat and SOCS box protein 5 n=1 Tax=Acipenser ruthenus TaxID=7906 RepID=A0A444U2R1_ACIRT|nr:Ankyrin repeat and SOCS box protein 5 [Acipenser ruthenus]
MIEGDDRQVWNAAGVVLDIDTGSWADRSPLHEAASQGRLLALKTLLSQVNATTIDGMSPLFNACSQGSATCVEILLEHGANPQSDACQPSPIHEASSKGRSECVAALISWGADVDQTIPHLGTPLYVACISQQLHCTQKLLDGGANVQKGKFLETPLHAAAQQNSPEVVKLLLDFGADINVKNLDLKRPVEAAAPSSLVEKFLLLHEERFDIKPTLGELAVRLPPTSLQCQNVDSETNPPKLKGEIKCLASIYSF